MVSVLSLRAPQTVDDSLAITDRISVRPDITNETTILGVLKIVSSQGMSPQTVKSQDTFNIPNSKTIFRVIPGLFTAAIFTPMMQKPWQAKLLVP